MIFRLENYPKMSQPQQSQLQQSQPQQSQLQQSQPQQSQPQQSQPQQSQPQQSQLQQSQPQQSQLQQSQPQQSQPQQSQPQQSQPQQSQPQQSQSQQSQPRQRGCLYHNSKEDCILNGAFDLFMNGSFPEDKNRIRFKYLPFQRVIREVVPPMAINFGKVMDFSVPDYIVNHISAKFYLSLIDLQRMNLTNISYDKKQSFQLQIRIGQKLSGIRDFSEILPKPIEMWINSRKIILDDRQSPIYVGVFDYLHLDTVNTNMITMIWPECSETYFLVAHLVEVLNIEEMVEDIKMNNDRYFSALTTKRKVMDILKNVDTGSSAVAGCRLSLLCPINKSKIKLPAKSVKCAHLHCFDLEAYISLNRIKNTWICPICKKSCLLADLNIDELVLFFINSLKVPKHCEEIQIYANGKWKPSISHGGSLEDVQTTSCGPSKKTILEIDLTNLDDEDLDNNVKTVLPITSAGNSNYIRPSTSTNTTTHTEEDKVDDTPILTYIESITIVKILPPSDLNRLVETRIRQPQ
ncbi:E3 SUMO-protein ligase PIAS2-like [Rhopalosiphum padi]|uniref:E3 SUMO-protein ligase PIAS2-like n=1 Tax=Rhopalosiphum padi TaxID=40932 RepID=UPI00298D937B|nr:E3 SUMO-protein ligase PIAS2-like [Rhopalosiphum padi]